MVQRTVETLLESQIGVLAHFQPIGWNTMVIMTGEYYPNLGREFYAECSSNPMLIKPIS